MRDAIYNVLNNDATLLVTLTGGVHKGIQISRQDTPTAFDANDELEPCALVKLSNDVAVGPYDQSSSLFVNIYLYQRSGVGSIDAARARIYSLLHRQKLTPVGGGTCWQIRSTDEILDTWDDTLNASMAVMRFMAMWLRP